MQRRDQSRTRKRKGAVKEMLAKRNLSEIRDWGNSDSQSLRTLSSLLFETDPLLRWRSIEALGLVAGGVFERDSDTVRRLIRRLLWLMNDESGGLCWHAPEAIAEVLYNCRDLLKEYDNILLSYTFEEPFEVGVRLGVARLADYFDDERDYLKSLMSSLAFRIPEIDLATSFAFNAIGVPSSEIVSIQTADHPQLEVYDFNKGNLVEITAENLAELNLSRMGYGRRS